jgi:hypothetical protein
MVLGRRLLSEYSARYSIFVELLIFITNERAPPTRVKKTIKLVGLGRDELRELDSISMSDNHRIMSSHKCAQQ